MHPHQKRTLAEVSVDGNNLASGSYRAIAKSGMPRPAAISRSAVSEIDATWIRENRSRRLPGAGDSGDPHSRGHYAARDFLAARFTLPATPSQQR